MSPPGWPGILDVSWFVDASLGLSMPPCADHLPLILPGPPSMSHASFGTASAGSFVFGPAIG